MAKKIDLNRTVFELTQEYPELIDILAGLGFTEITKKPMLHSAGKIMTIPKGAKIKLIGKTAVEGRTAVVSIQTPDRDVSEVAYLLDKNYGIMTRVGLHCAPNAHKTLGTYPTGTIRFSFGYFNREEEVLFAVKALEKILWN